jgi:hypothetical protein
MNKDHLLKFVQNPEQITANDKQSLAELVRTFPFFHTAHLLFLYNLKKTDSEEYDQQLRESAIYISDRRILFNLIYGIGTMAPSIIEDAEKPTDVDKTQNEPGITLSETKQELEKETPPLATPREAGQTELLEIDENLTQGYTENEHAREVEFSLLSEKLFDINHITPDPTFELEEEPHSNNPGNKSQPASFDLIEKFIEENPAFVPNKVDFSEEREDISAHSIVDNEDVATETLAMVFENQKLYDKAVSIYEKLILKFPEKRAYFASRIEELRNNLKQL